MDATVTALHHGDRYLDHCRSCGADLERLFVDLGQSPISNSLRHPDQEDEPEAFYPLRAFACDACGLVQIHDIAAREAHFNRDYAYFSSFSDTWLAHAVSYAHTMIARLGLGPASQVVEVASNDGYLLRYFKAAGVPVLGVDPAANCAEAAMLHHGVPTRVTFFGRQTARELVREGLSADLIAANNVLAHVPDINDFVAGFSILLKAEGVLTLEFPHLLQMIEGNYFDTIYHEHYSYLSLVAVEQVLRANGLRPFDVERLPTHGGSLRLYCCHAASAHVETEALAALRASEQAAELDRIEGYAGFTPRVEAVRAGFRVYLEEARLEGRRVAAYGAAAKGNTFLNYCGVTADEIVAAFDANPAKQGRYLPGSHVPILSPEAVASVRADDLLILPWNLKDEIVQQLAYIADWGGRFVTASPEVRIL